MVVFRKLNTNDLKIRKKSFDTLEQAKCYFDKEKKRRGNFYIELIEMQGSEKHIIVRFSKMNDRIVDNL